MGLAEKVQQVTSQEDVAKITKSLKKTNSPWRIFIAIRADRKAQAS